MAPSTNSPDSWSTDDTPQYLDFDERRVAYATYGDPTGRPVLFCHGTPGSRLLGQLLDAPATARGVHLIAPDRPGIGDSEDAAIGIDGWPGDAAALLNHVGAERAGVLGFSAGAPYALACHRLDTVESVTLISGAGPPGVGDMGRAQRAMGALARHAPWLSAPLVRFQRWVLARQDPEAALDLVADEPPETDALSTAEIARLVQSDVLTATAGGPSGAVRELGQVAEPWPFNLGDISVPVAVFQGQRDGNVAPATGEALVQQLTEATLERVNSDHLGTLCMAGPRALRSPGVVTSG